MYLKLLVENIGVKEVAYQENHERASKCMNFSRREKLAKLSPKQDSQNLRLL